MGAITVSAITPNPSNVTGYRVTEDATPLAPGDNSGGSGVIEIDASETGGSNKTYSTAFTLTDSDRGSTSGVVAGVSGGNGTLTITADSTLGLLNSVHIVEPFVGKFDDWVQTLLDLAGITATLTMSAAIADRDVEYPGGQVNTWDFLKAALVVQELEVALTSSAQIEIRTLRGTTLTDGATTSDPWRVSRGVAAPYTDVAYFGNDYGTQKVIYPRPGTAAAVYQVAAGGALVVELAVDASVIAVNQPAASNTISTERYTHEGTNGAYAILGADNTAIDATDFTDAGGSVTVARGDDPSVIRITIVGPTGLGNAPYRIATGGSTPVNGLYVTAEALTVETQVARIASGADGAQTGRVSTPLIRNPFIATLSDAIGHGGRAARQSAGVSQTITRSRAPAVMSFGTTAGARVTYGNAKYRVSTVTLREASADLTAIEDTTQADFAAVWSDDTDGSLFAAEWAGATSRDFALNPLQRS